MNFDLFFRLHERQIPGELISGKNVIVNHLESEIGYWPHNWIFPWWSIIKKILILRKSIEKKNIINIGNKKKHWEIVCVVKQGKINFVKNYKRGTTHIGLTTHSNEICKSRLIQWSGPLGTNCYRTTLYLTSGRNLNSQSLETE